MIRKISIAMCVFLTGCQGLRSSMGLERTAPDEFSVMPSSAPLDMPPDFHSLPTPQPGKLRPQETTVQDKARHALVGVTRTNHAMLSAGQRLLLQAADAKPGQDFVRSEIDREVRLKKKDQPLVETLGLRKEQPQGKALNPRLESEELQKQGIKTPSLHH